METFTRDIKFIQKVGEESNGSIVWKDEEVTRSAIFKELNRTDRDQHKLHFKIIAIAENFGGGLDEAKISSDGIYDLTVKAINTLLIIREGSVTAEDKKDFLNDSAAIFSFGMWLLTEKLMPFFLTFKMT